MLASTFPITLAHENESKRFVLILSWHMMTHAMTFFPQCEDGRHEVKGVEHLDVQTHYFRGT